MTVYSCTLQWKGRDYTAHEPYPPPQQGVRAKRYQSETPEGAALLALADAAKIGIIDAVSVLVIEQETKPRRFFQLLVKDLK